MARNAWENMGDATGMTPGVRQGVGFWGWMLRLLVVAGLTLAGAFYLPLYRAHKVLSSEYETLNQRVQTLDQELGGLRTELTQTKAKRDELEARHGMDQTRERATHELAEQIKTDLSGKMSRFIDKGAMAIVVRQNRVVVRLPQAVTQATGHADVTADARIELCALSSVVAARGAMDVRVLARDDGSTDADKARSPWELTAERSAAVARMLVEKCKYPSEHVEAAARPATKASEGSDQKGGVELEIDPGGGSALTAL
jgi:flagellar motor protein MotB